MPIIEKSAPTRKKWKQELSAGGVVFRRKNKIIEILLIKVTSRRNGVGKKRYAFPKGHPASRKESLKRAALREVHEEGGVKAKIREDLGTIHFFFSFRGEHISKTVQYYLMEYVSGSPTKHDQEVEEALFVPLARAARLLKMKTDKDILVRAKSAMHKLRV